MQAKDQDPSNPSFDMGRGSCQHEPMADRKSNFFLALVTLMISGWIGCASTPNFLNLVEQRPNEIFKDSFKKSMSPKVNQTLMAYRSRRLIATPLGAREYGQSVRSLDLRGLDSDSIRFKMTQLGCPETKDVLKNPKTHQPILMGGLTQIPMSIYLCPDGGVVRVKPQGDASSRFRPQPHASKSLRYPADAPFLSFDDEIVKIDNFGHVLPKWGPDLKVISSDALEQSRWVQDWADLAHTDLPMNSKKPSETKQATPPAVAPDP